MLKRNLLSLIATAALITSTSALALEPSPWATEAPSNPKAHTPQGLYINSVNTYKWMQESDDVILVDVRTPAEWQFVGYTPMAQIMIPSVFFKYNAFDEERGRYASYKNSEFILEFEERIADMNITSDTVFVLMCRSGSSRAQPAAQMLAQYGYDNVYIMTDGFEGGTVKEGEHKQFRLSSGWKVLNPTETWKYKIEGTDPYLEK